MPNDKANVNPRPAGEEPETTPANRETAEPAIKRPNEPGLNRDANERTGEPSVKPADEVSEGR